MDRTSHESAFDVAKDETIRAILNQWDRSVTQQLLAERKAKILAATEARLKTSAERELFAKDQLRLELVECATKGDLAGLRVILDQTVREAIQTNTRPRINAECRFVYVYIYMCVYVYMCVCVCVCVCVRSLKLLIVLFGNLRNEHGQSLLSIASQRNDISLAKFLLEYWKQCDTDK